MKRVVLVTGGAKGIGRALCEAFALRGDKVYFVDTDTGAGKELESKVGAVFIQADVSDQIEVQAAVDKVIDKENKIDVLVNNAGISLNIDPLDDDAITCFEKVINTNLRGAFLFSHYAAKHMEDGAIINISSTRALQSEPHTEGYSASKGGIIALTHAMAMSLAENRIRVNAISPGWIDVQHYESKAASNPPSPQGEPQKITHKDHEQHPVGRVGEPEDIAKMALFLADNKESGFITGQNFVVDGGMTKKMIYV